MRVTYTPFTQVSAACMLPPGGPVRLRDEGARSARVTATFRSDDELDVTSR